MSHIFNLSCEISICYSHFLTVDISYRRSAVDHSTTFSQLSSRGGRTHRNLLLFYTQIVGDYANVLAHHISGTRFADAIAMLREAPFEKGENIRLSLPSDTR